MLGGDAPPMLTLSFLQLETSDEEEIMVSELETSDSPDGGRLVERELEADAGSTTSELAMVLRLTTGITRSSSTKFASLRSTREAMEDDDEDALLGLEAEIPEMDDENEVGDNGRELLTLFESLSLSAATAAYAEAT
jgi:hypothetical protein